MSMSSGLYPRPRYNSQIMAKFVDTDPEFAAGDPGISALARTMAHAHSKERNRYWDADLQSYMYLQDFVATEREWRTKFYAKSRESGEPSQEMCACRLADEIRGILELAPEREERFMEIIDQDDADGAVNYWLGMLQISPARHPATYLMVRIGRRIGEHVVMCLKGDFASPRPSQLCPGLMPMIDPPATPSFPAGHAVQAYLMSYLLAYSLPRIPQQYRVDSGNKKVLGDDCRDDELGDEQGPLFKLAYRVSQNRVVAGVHFPTDIKAGREIGIECFKVIRRVDTLWNGKESLRARVREEFPQYA